MKHGSRSPRRRSRPCATGERAVLSRSAGEGSTCTGWRTSATGASRGSCGGAIASRCGTATRVQAPVVRPRWTRPPARSAAGTVEQDEDVLDTWFSLVALAVRDAGLAGGDAGPAPLLPDRRPRHRARHHLLLGRAHDHGGLRVHAARCRSATSTSHGIVRDAEGRKMSQVARATSPDPLEMIDRLRRRRRALHARCFRGAGRRTSSLRRRRSRATGTSPTRSGMPAAS